MATLTPGKPLTQAAPELLVENELPAGRYRFQLVVTDDADNESDPAELVVTVRGPIRPRDPVIRPEILDRIEPTVLRPGVLRPGVIRPGVIPRIRPR
jgi:hypothetical protein